MKILNLSESSITIKTDNKVYNLAPNTVSDEIIFTRNLYGNMNDLMSMFGSKIRFEFTAEERMRMSHLITHIPADNVLVDGGLVRVEDESTIQDTDTIIEDSEGNKYKFDAETMTPEGDEEGIKQEIEDRKAAISQEVIDRNAAIKVETDRATAKEAELLQKIEQLTNTVNKLSERVAALERA